MSRITEIKTQIADLTNELKQIQSECSHPVSCVTGKYGANTGNWCPDDDVWWITLYCSLCDKGWTVYSHSKDDAYRQAAMKYKVER
jgi:hypothetical protein